MNKLLILILLAMSPLDLADAEQVVRCHEIGFSRSVEMGDRARFASFIDADARFVGSTVRRGVSDISEAWSVFFADGGPSIKWRPNIVEVLEDGQLALSRGPFRMTAVDAEGNAREVWGTFNSVWRNHGDGHWTVVFDAGSSEPESPSDEVKALLEKTEDCGLIMNSKQLNDFAQRYAEAWSGGDAAAFAAFYAENGSLRINEGEPAVGRTAVEQMAAGFMTNFPDMVVRLVELRPRGNQVEFHWRWTGTNTGPGGTGNAVDLTGFETWTFDADGLILQSLGHMDEAEYERQLHGEAE